MKLTISMENKRLSVKLSDSNCDVLFNNLVQDTLGFKPVVQEIKRAVQCGDVHEKIIPQEAQPKVATPFTIQKGYTGFLYIRCPKCGKERGFCSKYPITEFTCKECGHKITIPEKLHTVFFFCKCGRSFKYLTNIEAEMFEISCIDCGSPNAVFRNPKTGNYTDEEAKN